MQRIIESNIGEEFIYTGETQAIAGTCGQFIINCGLEPHETLNKIDNPQDVNKHDRKQLRQ